MRTRVPFPRRRLPSNPPSGDGKPSFSRNYIQRARPSLPYDVPEIAPFARRPRRHVRASRGATRLTLLCRDRSTAIGRPPAFNCSPNLTTRPKPRTVNDARLMYFIFLLRSRDDVCSEAEHGTSKGHGPGRPSSRHARVPVETTSTLSSFFFFFFANGANSLVSGQNRYPPHVRPSPYASP